MILEHIPSFAKINLYLYIFSKYKNGYHKIITLFQSIDLHDLIDLEITNSSLNTTNLEIIGYEVPVNDNNTVLKALRLFRQYSGKFFWSVSDCIRIFLQVQDWGAAVQTQRLCFIFSMLI